MTVAAFQGLLAGRFVIEREVGRGGVGIVYRARDEVTGSLVALKVIGTDPARALGMGLPLVKHYNSTWFGEEYPVNETMAGYQAPPLDGIWATAPYLHNGSVPNLWELLTPPEKRKSTFMVGSRLFDPKNVGYVTDQSPFKSGNFVADPGNANGNGNGGHAYGTTLSDDDRWAIIEYLKTL